MIYLKKFEYGNYLKRGERKQAETINGRELLRYAVLEEYGIDTQTLAISTGEHGKPYFSEHKDIQFNISHSGDYVAVAVGENPLGIDIQTVRPIKDGLVEKLCSDTEKNFICNSTDKNKAFIALWTLKESYIKAIGTGMSFPMNSINFDLNGFSQEDLHSGISGYFSNQSGFYFIKDLGEFVLSVCLLENSG